MNTFTEFKRLLIVSLCLSVVGCCGMCKKLASCNDYSNLLIRVQRSDRTRIKDTLTVVIFNDSIMTNKKSVSSPPIYTTSTPSPNEPTSYVDINLGMLAYDVRGSLTNSQIIGLKNFRFKLYAANSLISTIDSIKTGIDIIDCGQLQCASVLSFRDNGRVITDTYSHLINY